MRPVLRVWYGVMRDESSHPPARRMLQMQARPVNLSPSCLTHTAWRVPWRCLFMTIIVMLHPHTVTTSHQRHCTHPPLPLPPCRPLSRVHPAGGLVPRLLLLVCRRYPLTYWCRGSKAFVTPKLLAAAQQRAERQQEQVCVGHWLGLLQGSMHC